jgi:hypothetical protein
MPPKSAIGAAQTLEDIPGTSVEGALALMVEYGQAQRRITSSLSLARWLDGPAVTVWQIDFLREDTGGPQVVVFDCAPGETTVCSLEEGRLCTSAPMASGSKCGTTNTTAIASSHVDVIMEALQ